MESHDADPAPLEPAAPRDPATPLDPAGRPSVVEAAAGLALVDAERHAMADRLRHGPRWYAPCYGVIVGLLVLAPAGPPPLLLVHSGLALAALAGLVTAYRRSTGLWFSPSHPSAPRAPVVALVAVLLLGVALVALATHVWHQPVVAVLAAAATGTGAAVLSRTFDVAWARSLERA